MSRHDTVLKIVDKYVLGKETGMTQGALIVDLASALKHEIAAHDVTRDARNRCSERVGTLLGNVRGLESKVSALQTVLNDTMRADSSQYSEGYRAGLAAVRAAIEALEKT